MIPVRARVTNSDNSTARSRAPVSSWEPSETVRLLSEALSGRCEALLSTGVEGSSTNTDTRAQGGEGAARGRDRVGSRGPGNGARLAPVHRRRARERRSVRPAADAPVRCRARRRQPRQGHGVSGRAHLGRRSAAPRECRAGPKGPLSGPKADTPSHRRPRTACGTAAGAYRHGSAPPASGTYGRARSRSRWRCGDRAIRRPANRREAGGAPAIGIEARRAEIRLRRGSVRSTRARARRASPLSEKKRPSASPPLSNSL